MNDKVTAFPQYRKLSNNKVYYQIINERCFHEIQIIGETAQHYKTEAKQYPEILRINDLIELSFVGFELSTEDEFNQILTNYNLEIRD